MEIKLITFLQATGNAERKNISRTKLKPGDHPSNWNTAVGVEKNQIRCKNALSRASRLDFQLYTCAYVFTHPICTMQLLLAVIYKSIVMVAMIAA
mmetsp:Transcript_35586/g.68693  ORF Transcript_35586/g.68693 Transcript_35586/m.68693 type:complete len:95 (-) Transcript_35586:61-345(-)